MPNGPVPNGRGAGGEACALVAVTLMCVLARDFSVGLMAGTYVVFALGQGLMYGTNMTCAVLETGLAALRSLSADAALVAACLVGADARATGRAAERLALALLLGRQWQVVAVLLGWLLHGRLAFFSPLR